MRSRRRIVHKLIVHELVIILHLWTLFYIDVRYILIRYQMLAVSIEYGPIDQAQFATYINIPDDNSNIQDLATPDIRTTYAPPTQTIL